MSRPIELSCTDPNHRRPLVTIETPLYPLSEFTPEEAAKVAEFEAAPTPPEVLREQVARAMHETPPEHPGVYGRIKWERLPESGREAYRRMADAALAVFRGQQDPAVQRVEAVCESWETDLAAGNFTTDSGLAESLLAHLLSDIGAAIGGDGR